MAGSMRKIFTAAAICILASALCEAALVLDPVFNSGPGTDNFAEQALPLPDGKILVCGDFMTYNDYPSSSLIRLNEDGSVDTTFHHLVSSWVRHMVVQPDGKIVIGGAF